MTRVGSVLFFLVYGFQPDSLFAAVADTGVHDPIFFGIDKAEKKC